MVNPIRWSGVCLGSIFSQRLFAEPALFPKWSQIADFWSVPEPSGGTVKTLKLKTIQPRFNLSGDRVSASLNQKMTKTIRFTLDTLACPK